MVPGNPTGDRGQTRDANLRRRLVLVATIVEAIGTLHFVDHAVRGRLVVDRGLNHDWNHSGWPFQHDFSPFTVSMIVVYGLLLGGIWFTLRRRLWAAYWLGTAVIIGAIVVFVHFVGSDAETPRMILDTYDNLAAAIPALIVLFGVIAILVVMAGHAIYVRRASGRWL
jgi:hypothetical protein